MGFGRTACQSAALGSKGVPRASRPQCVADPHRSQPRSGNTTIATRCRTLRAQTATPPCTLACTRTAATTCAQPGESAWSRAGPCAAVCLPPGEMPRAPPTVSVRPRETAWMRGWDACLGATDTAICVTVHASHVHTPLTPAEPAQSPRSPLHPAAPLARRSATRGRNGVRCRIRAANTRLDMRPTSAAGTACRYSVGEGGSTANRAGSELHPIG